MARLPRWEVGFLRRTDGTDPFSDFVSELSAPARIEWEAVIQLLQEYGDSLQGERVRVHNDEFEFRGDEVHVFYKKVAAARMEVTAGLCVDRSTDP